MVAIYDRIGRTYTATRRTSLASSSGSEGRSVTPARSSTSAPRPAPTSRRTARSWPSILRRAMPAQRPPGAALAVRAEGEATALRGPQLRRGAGGNQRPPLA
ncbi:MAG: hypothetical protein AVDCRST_MAG17-14 [uncultured Solirubrobacterales bacterium]|uniref:Uncharacterized protein n=1 Tax=uncultured Solirubrobacterales bacterium TaxID=768556 RepID=A0A6J4RPI4_9ACTN|nr:MAG: hypothetical protein AVDCRST_MAG17-14 [uncultured Solirubrobacterales bacterium]